MYDLRHQGPEPMQHWRQPPQASKGLSRSDVRFLVFITLIVLVILFFAAIWATDVLAAEPKDVTCPTAGQPCKVLVLTPQEEQLLVEPKGILDSAAAARYLDLGNVVSYFRMKLMQAPSGEVKPIPASSATKPALTHPLGKTKAVAKPAKQ